MSWGGLYGGAWGTSTQSLAKEDTRLLLLGSTTDDESQYATDLTASGSAGYELSSARGAITGATGRDVYVRCELTSAEADVILIAHGATDASGVTWAISTDSSGNIEVRQGSAAIWTGPAAPAGDCSISWSTRANPDTTGASDALISEVVIYDHTAGAYLTIEQFSHAVPTTSTGYTLTVGGYYVTGPGLVAAPTNAPTKARVSNAWHPSTEVAEDWITERTAYAGTLDDGIAEPVPLTVASGIGDSGELVGRANAGYAAAHAKAVQRRCWSPLVDEAYRNGVELKGNATGYAVRYLLTAPGSSSHKMGLHWLRWVEVPPGATHAWVRVHVQSWVTTGSAVPLSLRCYAMNRPPTVSAIAGQQAIPVPALEYAYVEQTLTADDMDSGIVGVGRWLDFGLLRLPMFTGPHVGWTDTVHLCLAYVFDPAGASANDTNARARINAWHARPVEKWTPGGLFGG